MRFAPGSSPGLSATWLYCTTPSGSMITIARLEKPAGSKYAPNAREAAH